MCEEQKQPDWTCSDAHFRISTATSTEEKQAQYDEYAKIYDEAAVDMDWRGPSIIVDRLWEKVMSYPSNGQNIRIIDIGCGTGLVGERLREIDAFSKLPLHFIGLDFNESMLAFARKRRLYHEVICDDFHNVALDKGPADFLIACGLFWQGDYGPEALPTILRLLKAGGYAAITVRRKWFVEKDFSDRLARCGCDLVDNTVLPYIGDKVEAHYLVLQKHASTGNTSG